MILEAIKEIDVNPRNQLPQMDEEAFVKAASNGDLDAFNQLVLEYQNLIYNFIYSLVGEPESAEDITQESFIKAYQKLHSFRGGSFRSWLMRIATNSAYDFLRRSRRYPTQQLFLEDENGDEMDSAPWLADPSASVQDVFEQNELLKTVFTLLEELPNAYRIVLTLIDVHEFDYAEAAQALNVPIGTVKSRLVRARLQMKNKLSSVLPEDSQTDITNLCLAV